jgi:hypothetical protein
VRLGNVCVAEEHPPAVRCGSGTKPVAGECVPTESTGIGDLVDEDVDLRDIPGYLPACIDAPVVAASAGSCAAVDGQLFQCNPVSNAGCEGGEQCVLELDEQGELAFICASDAGPLTSCERCNPMASVNGGCGPGYACMGGLSSCQRHCCDSSDCGQGAECVLQPPMPFGICQAQGDGFFDGLFGNAPSEGGAGGGGGGGGAGGDPSGGAGGR